MYNEVTKHLENNEIACSLFLDLKKVFDTVNLRPGGGVILPPPPVVFRG